MNFGAIFFPADCVVTAMAAWLLFRLCEPANDRLLDQILGWILCGVFLVTGDGVILGVTGGFGCAGFFAMNAAALILLTLVRSRHWQEDVVAARALFTRFRRNVDGHDWSTGLSGAGLIFLLLLGMLAALPEPVVFDSLTYRLSRVGLWLQDGHIRSFATDDARLNYMPVTPDVLVAWLVGWQQHGFHLTGLVQWLGGILAIGSSCGLARQMGLTRAASLGVGFLLFALPNVVVQFTSSHSDLITTGLLTASLYLWRSAQMRRRGSVLGGLGAALALSSKGTVFYLAPSLLVWGVMVAVRYRVAFRHWWPTLAGGAVGLLLFAAPGYWRNLQAYGHWEGPIEDLHQHHGNWSWGHLGEKMRLNLASSAIQMLEPEAQPPGGKDICRRIGLKLSAQMPESDAYTFLPVSRRALLDYILLSGQPDADTMACGVWPVMVALLALAAALLKCRSEPAAREVMVVAAVLGLFLLVFHGLRQWHEWGFRFLVLGAPWWALMVGWFLARLPGWWRRFAISVCTIATILTTVPMIFQVPQSGWMAWQQPERTVGRYVAVRWEHWFRSLPGTSGPVRVALPINMLLTAFVSDRSSSHPQVILESVPRMKVKSAKEALQGRDGWLIVTADRFSGSEDGVQKQMLMMDGAALQLYSLAAYRLLPP